MKKIIHHAPGETRYWIAVNGASCTLSSMPATTIPETIPRAKNLIGFPTLERAREAQRHLLEDPLEDCEESLEKWRDDPSVTIVVHQEAEPPPKGETVWMFASCVDAMLERMCELLRNDTDLLRKVMVLVTGDDTIKIR